MAGGFVNTAKHREKSRTTPNICLPPLPLPSQRIVLPIYRLIVDLFNYSFPLVPDLETRTTTQANNGFGFVETKNPIPPYLHNVFWS